MKSTMMTIAVSISTDNIISYHDLSVMESSATSMAPINIVVKMAQDIPILKMCCRLSGPAACTLNMCIM